MKEKASPSSAIDLYERALKLNPSPEQRIRLRLTLGDKLEQQDQDQDAYDDYKNCSRNRRIIPAERSIYQKLLALARKLNKPDDVARYEALIQMTGNRHGDVLRHPRASRLSRLRE